MGERRSLAQWNLTQTMKMGHFHLESPLTIKIDSYVNICMFVSKEVRVLVMKAQLMMTSFLTKEETPTCAMKEDQRGFDNQAYVADADKMPEDWYFPGMLAFFLWGFIVENEECAIYKSKQFQIGDTKRPEEKGMNIRKQLN